MPYRAIFSDIDGTLLNSEHQITSLNLKAIQRVMALGIPFTLVSARPPQAITPYTQQIGGEAYLVAFNGALMVDSELNEIFSLTLNPEDFKALGALLEPRAQLSPNDLSPNYYVGFEWFSPNPDNPWTQQEEQITGIKALGKKEDLITAHKILVMGEPDIILALEQELQMKFPHLAIHRSKATYLEIVHQQVNKAQAVALLAERLGVSAKECIAFGDQYNDIPMIQWAGLGIAMENAPDEVKSYAQKITQHHNQDGIAFALNELFPEA